MRYALIGLMAAGFSGYSLPDDVLSGKYPLARFLYVYVNKAPNRPADPLVQEFVKFVLSREGQEIVVKDGYLPIAKRVVDEELAKLR